MNLFDYSVVAAFTCMGVGVGILTHRLNVVNKNLHYMRDMFEMFAKATIGHVEHINERIDSVEKKKKKQDA